MSQKCLTEWMSARQGKPMIGLITIVLVVMRMNCTSCSATRLRSEKCQAVENKSFGIAERLSKLRTIFCSSQVAWSFSKIFVCIFPNWGAFFNSCGSQVHLVFKQYLCLYFSKMRSIFQLLWLSSWPGVSAVFVSEFVQIEDHFFNSCSSHVGLWSFSSIFFCAWILFITLLQRSAARVW